MAIGLGVNKKKVPQEYAPAETASLDATPFQVDIWGSPNVQATQETPRGQRWAIGKRADEGSMSIGIGRPKSKLPNPSTNTKSTGKQDYLAEALNSKKEKQPWQSA